MADKVVIRLSPERFSYELYEPDFSRLGMSYNLFPSDPKTGEEELVAALKEKAIGFCDAGELLVRPRPGEYAIMCEDEDGKFWFHITKKILSQLQICSVYSEAINYQMMKPILDAFRKVK